METFALKFQLFILYVIGWLLPVFPCAWVFCVLAEHGIRPCRALRAFFGRLPAAGRVIVAACALGLFVYGSTKNDTTNAPPAGQSAPRCVQRTAPSEVVTADDVARGYRLAGETDAHGVNAEWYGVVCSNIFSSEAGPSLSVSFSKSAVIFEDAYQDGPGVTKPRRSTRVRLTVSAYGGPNGGTFLLVPQNLDKLADVLEGPIDLPTSRTHRKV